MRVRTLTLVIAGMALASQAPHLQGETAELAFDSLFNLGAVLEDRNGDGIADFVNVADRGSGGGLAIRHLGSGRDRRPARLRDHGNGHTAGCSRHRHRAGLGRPTAHPRGPEQ